MAAAPKDELLQLLAPVVTADGLDLEDVEVTPAGKRRLVRILVDKDGGLSLDDVAGVSTHVSAALDASDVLGSTPYVLEVSSPGIGRPLTERRHWRRARTRLVTVSLHSGDDVTGYLLDETDEGLTVRVDATDRTVSWTEVAGGRVEVDFSAPAKEA